MTNKFQQMTPKEIVAELDKYIIGQDKAKRSVAIALEIDIEEIFFPKK